MKSLGSSTRQSAASRQGVEDVPSLDTVNNQMRDIDLGSASLSSQAAHSEVRRSGRRSGAETKNRDSSVENTPSKSGLLSTKRGSKLISTPSDTSANTMKTSGRGKRARKAVAVSADSLDDTNSTGPSGVSRNEGDLCSPPQHISITSYLLQAYSRSPAYYETFLKFHLASGMTHSASSFSSSSSLSMELEPLSATDAAAAAATIPRCCVKNDGRAFIYREPIIH